MIGMVSSFVLGHICINTLIPSDAKTGLFLHSHTTPRLVTGVKQEDILSVISGKVPAPSILSPNN